MAVQISGNDITVPRDGSFTRNVTIGGTLTYEDVTNIDSVGLVTARTGIEIGARPGVAASISVDGNMIISGISTFGDDVKINVDSKKILLGAGADLEVFHNGTNSHLRTQTGDLIIDNNSGGAVKIRPKVGEEGVVCTTDGSTALYHDGTKKFETSSTGVTITGTVTSDGLVLSDSDEIQLGNSTDFRIYHDSSNSYIRDVGTGNLIISGSAVNILNGAASESMIRCTENGAVELYHDNNKRLATYNEGIEVFGIEGGNASIKLSADEGDDNNDQYRLIAGDGTSIYLQNYASGSWESNIVATGNGSVDLYYDNSKKFETTSTGITVTGSVSVTTEPAFRVGLVNANTSVSHNNNYTIPFDTDSGDGVFDTNGCFDTSNHRFTPNLAGYYYLHFQVRCELPSADHLYQARIKHSSGNYVVISQEFNKSGNDNSSAQASCIQYFNGSSDYVTAEFYQNSGSTLTVFGGTTYHYQTFFEGYFVRSA